MKLLIAFLKDKTREISLYAGTVGIFIVVAFLYNIRMDALKYALAAGDIVAAPICNNGISSLPEEASSAWNGLRRARRNAQKNFQSAGIFWNWIIRNYWGSLTKRFWS